MSMENELYVLTCKVNHEGNRVLTKCQKKQITNEQLKGYAEQLKDYLLRIDYNKTHSYDSSDDDRVEDSYSSWNGVKYCEIDPLKNGKHLVVEGDTVIGVAFYVRDNSGDTEKRVFLFDGSVQQTISMGYSASHSSDWTYINKVFLVKRGEDGAPQTGNSVNFEQSKMYPSI